MYTGENQQLGQSSCPAKQVGRSAGQTLSPFVNEIGQDQPVQWQAGGQQVVGQRVPGQGADDVAERGGQTEGEGVPGYAHHEPGYSAQLGGEGIHHGLGLAHAGLVEGFKEKQQLFLLQFLVLIADVSFLNFLGLRLNTVSYRDSLTVSYSDSLSVSYRDSLTVFFNLFFLLLGFFRCFDFFSLCFLLFLHGNFGYNFIGWDRVIFYEGGYRVLLGRVCPRGHQLRAHEEPGGKGDQANVGGRFILGGEGGYAKGGHSQHRHAVVAQPGGVQLAVGLYGGLHNAARLPLVGFVEEFGEAVGRHL